MKRAFLLTLALLFMSGFVFATSYNDYHQDVFQHDRYDSAKYDDDYLIRQYYMPSDYPGYLRYTSYGHHDHDRDYRLYDLYPDGYDSRYDYSRGGNSYYDTHDLYDTRGRRVGDMDFRQRSNVYVDRHDYKIKHSPVMNKYYVTKCYTYPPRNSLIYVRC